MSEDIGTETRRNTYWPKSTSVVISQQKEHIEKLLSSGNSVIQSQFEYYLSILQNQLSNNITQKQSTDILAQLIITKPIFESIFTDSTIPKQHVITQTLDTIENVFRITKTSEFEELEKFYNNFQIYTKDDNKQHIIVDIYGDFFKKANPENSKTLGIVYTPIEIVDFIIISIEKILQDNFDTSISNKNVSVWEPFAGTGVFITRLLASRLIETKDIQRKYLKEIHVNELNPLAHYIASINIEMVFHEIAKPSQYTCFNGITYIDTFSAAESNKQPSLFPDLFESGTKPLKYMDTQGIKVIISNPPWSGINIPTYPYIDNRVKETYARLSSASNLSSLYDPYVKSIRLASDLILSNEQGGIVGFVTNNGFIESIAFDGFRKTIADEFDTIYCLNLRGNARTSGIKRKQEGGSVFESGSRAGTAIILLVKQSSSFTHSNVANIYYQDIGNYLSKKEKLDIMSNIRLPSTK